MLLNVLPLFSLLLLCDSHRNENISCVFGESVENPLCHYRLFENWNNFTIHQENKTSEQLRTLSGPAHGLNGRTEYLSFIGANTQFELKNYVRLSGHYCMSLDYYLFGPKANLEIYAWRDPSERNDNRNYDYLLFVRNEVSSFFDRWLNYKATVNFYEDDYKITINARAQLPGTLALDNIKFEKGVCHGDEDSPYGLVKRCNFDGIIGSADEGSIGCNFITPITQEYTSVSVKSQDSINPLRMNQDGFHNRDHTTQTGYGGFLELALSNSFYHDPENLIELVLATVTPEDGEHCLSFWLMSGSHVNEWEVTESAVNTNITNVLHRSGESDDHNNWQSRMIKVDPVVPIVIKIRFIQGARIRFDDFKFTKARCLSPLSCDFKYDMCGYTRRETADTTWYHGRGRLSEHSNAQLNVNYDEDYAYVDLKTSQNNEATLISNLFRVTGPHCYRFSFTAEPNTTIRIHTLGGHNGIIMMMSSTQFTEETAPWRTGLSDILANGKNELAFRVLIVINGNGNGTIFRIREAAMEEGTCAQYLDPRPRQVISYRDLNFHCYRTGHYIPLYRSCDGVIDCPMGEDEDQHCALLSCTHGGIPCNRRGHDFCLADYEQFCNGEKDCDDAIDEDPRMCNRESFCDNYCLNGGECAFNNFKCKCTSNFIGKRCT